MSIKFVQSTKDFNDFVKHNKYLVANFTASWCGPCQAIKPVLDQLYTDTNARYEKIEVIRVDLDTQRDLALKYKVASVPAFVFIENGQEVKRVNGANVPELIKSLDEMNQKAASDPSSKGRAGNGAVVEKLSDNVSFKGIDEFIPKGFEVLNGSIDYGGFEALNGVPLFKGTEGADVKNLFKLDYKKDTSTVVSDADSQLLFYIPLLNISKVYSVLLKFRTGESIAEAGSETELELDSDDLKDESQIPSLIKVWANHQGIISFDDAASDGNAPHIEKISQDANSVWYEIKLKFVRFQNVQSLTVFFDGEDEDYHTLLDKIVLVGVNGETKEQGKISKLEDD
ncbi:thioredoxin [Scheffersomyces xylosifermentans]|uniref:thioredoxin n=1 Tax=Scheffersomyces xylosifermentans TaxID=1304137 RepID=UPI00315C71B9